MSTKSIEADKFTEYEGIKVAIGKYVENAKNGDGKAQRPLFYKYAYVVGSLNGECVEADVDAFAKIVSTGGSSPDLEHHIAWIDISGPAAAVKLEFVNWHGNRFTDFLVLYKDGNTWKVSGMVFDAHEDN